MAKGHGRGSIAGRTSALTTNCLRSTKQANSAHSRQSTGQKVLALLPSTSLRTPQRARHTQGSDSKRTAFFHRHTHDLRSATANKHAHMRVPSRALMRLPTPPPPIFPPSPSQTIGPTPLSSSPCRAPRTCEATWPASPPCPAATSLGLDLNLCHTHTPAGTKAPRASRRQPRSVRPTHATPPYAPTPTV